MRRSKSLLLLIPLFLLLAGQSATPASEGEYVTLKCVRTDKSANQAWYVPIKAVVSGPGNATSPFELIIGKNRLLQGMLSLSVDEAELQVLAERLQQKHGRQFELKKDLTANLQVSLEFADKTLWQHNMLAGSQGLPFQIQLPTGQKARLNVIIQYNSGAGEQAQTKTLSFSRKTTSIVSSNEKAGEESFIASFSTTSEKSEATVFRVEQSLEL